MEKSAARVFRALEHIGRSVWGIRYSQRNLFTLLTSFFDEAGGEEHGLTAVCGWTSTVEQWDGFEVDWTLFLAKYDMPYFHMKELLGPSRKSPFYRWKGQKLIQAKFLSDAAEIIGRRIKQGFIHYVPHHAYATVDSLFDLRSVVRTPYALAGRSAIEMANEWRSKGVGGLLEMRHVFEDGPKENRNSLVAAMSSVTPFLSVPSFESGRDVEPCEEWPDGRKGVVQLQAADYLAYESRKAFVDRIKKQQKPHRKSLQAILGVPILMGSTRAAQLARYCFSQKIAPRLPADSAIYDTFKI